MTGLAADLAATATFTSGENGISRLAWTPPLAAAYAYVESRMQELGMDTRRDGAGNLIGTWHPGAQKAIAVGSHLDSVPEGGNYDGTLGVLSGLEAVRILQRENFQPVRPVMLIAFMDEEGARFGAPLFGSRAFSGQDMSTFGDLRDSDGISICEAMAQAGFPYAGISENPGIDSVEAYLELHIEQGPVLEAQDRQIGAVTAISGGHGLHVGIRGTPGHSGTIPMAMRRDALVGASRIIARLPLLAAENPGLLLTVGQISARPGAINVVPGACDFTVDVRSVDPDLLIRGTELVRRLVTTTAAESALEAEITVLHKATPLTMDPGLRTVIIEAARLEGVDALEMPSGAGHDALMVGRRVPAGMIFVPSRAGISHHPDEFTALEDCERGSRVLARTLARLAGRAGTPPTSAHHDALAHS